MNQVCLDAWTPSGQVSARLQGALGVLELTRPEAMNALTLGMVRDLTHALQQWAQASEVQAVVILGRPDCRGRPVFSAGGDVRFLHQAARQNPSELEAFFNEEYALNHLVHHYAKPVLALLDGPVLGGGLGLAQGAKLRVVNERSQLAMPETRIGLVPDVGSNAWLSQLPGRLGEWLSVTGQALSAGDAIELGLADVFVPAADWEAMVRELLTGHQPHAEHVVATVMERAALAPMPQQLGHRAAIDRHFGQASLADILRSMAEEPDSPWALATRAQLASNSPLMMAVGLALVRRSRGLSLADTLRLERSVMQHAWTPGMRGEHCEAMEGIRALNIDKDHAPRWQPADVAAVHADAVEAFFADVWAPAAHPLAALR